MHLTSHIFGEKKAGNKAFTGKKKKNILKIFIHRCSIHDFGVSGSEKLQNQLLKEKYIIS